MWMIVVRCEFCCGFHSVSHDSLRDNGISVTLEENRATTSLCKIVICQITTINDVPPSLIQLISSSQLSGASEKNRSMLCLCSFEKWSDQFSASLANYDLRFSSLLLFSLLSKNSVTFPPFDNIFLVHVLHIIVTNTYK